MVGCMELVGLLNCSGGPEWLLWDVDGVCVIGCA